MLSNPRQLKLLTTAPQCQGACWCGDYGMEGECPVVRSDDLLLPSDPDFLSAIAEVGGFDFGTTRARPVAVPQLPRCLPQVDGTSVCKRVESQYVAVTFGILRRRAGAHPRVRRSLAERLHLRQGTQVVLLMIARDDELDDVWARRGIWLTAMATWEPSLVVAPDFSVWDGDPTFFTRYNIVRSLRFYGALQEAGFRAIPHMFWANEKDLVEWAAWLNANPVPAVAIDLQCRGRDGRWLSDFLVDLAMLRAWLKKRPLLLLNGIDVGRDLTRFMEVWPEISVTASYAVEAAKHRMPVLTPRGSIRFASSDRSPDDLLAARIQFVEQWLARTAA